MTFTDPPYNVDLGHHGGYQRGAKRRSIANDALDPVAWEAFVRSWTRNLLAVTDGALYVCMSSKELPARLPGPGRRGRPLERHAHLGQGPLRPRAGRLPAFLRADLVWLAGRVGALLVR